MTRIPYCGECNNFLHEDITGYGYCEFTRLEQRCSDQCLLHYSNLTKRQTIRALHSIQKWRRGGNKPMPHPYVIGQVIDRCINLLRQENNED